MRMVKVLCGASVIAAILTSGCSGSSDPVAETVTVTEDPGSSDTWASDGEDFAATDDEEFEDEEDYFDDESDGESLEDAVDPVVEKSGIGLAGDGDFMTWGAVVKNDGPELGGVSVTAHGFNRAGQAVDSEEEYFFRLPTGESLVGGMFDGTGVTSVDVEVSTDNVLYEENSDPVSGDLEGDVTVSGQDGDVVVTVNVTSTLDVATEESLPFSIVYFNDDGEPVGGAGGFTPGSIPAGSTKQISVQDGIIGPPVPDNFKSARIFFDVSDEYLKAY